ncbi:MAG TPA: AMP-binding protein [Solirubrobacteraceae bacterium]|jgi:acyl-CoA synthetase (AMP-forming)/AMP-acid ligase II|nr:AMP-binding protein [Solirubrobacteraceae bacterium]
MNPQLLTRQALYKAHVARTLLATGMLRPTRPDRALRSAAALRRWGPTPAAAYAGAAIRYPDRAAIVDDRGTLTFAEVQARTNALAAELARAGISEHDGVAIMCRNHRGFIDATVACSKLGASALYLNTAFAGPQLADVLEREQPAAVIYDDEFSGLVRAGAEGRKRFVAWHEPGAAVGDPLLEDLIARGDPSELAAPAEKGRVVILTSGTTGAPKGAERKEPDSLEPMAAMLSKIPLRAQGATMIAAPMFHSWGLAHFTLALPLSSTIVLRRKFDPEDTLRAAAHHRASALALVPVMLQRILDLGPETIARYDMHALKVIALSGSALPGDLATRTMDVFGDVLYNLYGSTEVAWATIATPEDLRAAPGTAGRPPMGTVVKLLDDQGREVGAGQGGRIFVANEMMFDGYTGGGGKEIVGGLMSTGDVGHFDSDGRLFVDGRDDEMIVSGGENVFPREVEDLLAHHEAIEEAAVVGVPDEEFGERLKAFIVRRNGASLDEEQVKRYVRDNLARFKVPRDVVFVAELPRNETGKVLKRVLRADE